VVSIRKSTTSGELRAELVAHQPLEEELSLGRLAQQLEKKIASKKSEGYVLKDGLGSAMLVIDKLPAKERYQCLQTCITIFKNIQHNSDNIKFRTLKLSNERFCSEVWNHEGGKALLEAAGWHFSGDIVQLDASVDVSEALNFIQDNRYF
ncbi:unnamed protein product, partial [Meganyctiphanes norvegica]